MEGGSGRDGGLRAARGEEETPGRNCRREGAKLSSGPGGRASLAATFGAADLEAAQQERGTEGKEPEGVCERKGGRLLLLLLRLLIWGNPNKTDGWFKGRGRDSPASGRNSV